MFDCKLRYGEDWELWTRLARQGRFTAVRSRRPTLFVRERPNGAYGTMAAWPASFTACMEAIHGDPALTAVFNSAHLSRLRRRAEAENEWIIGRELIRHGHWPEGRKFLYRSVRAAPSTRRLAIMALSFLPIAPLSAFRRYSPTDRT